MTGVILRAAALALRVILRAGSPAIGPKDLAPPNPKAPTSRASPSRASAASATAPQLDLPTGPGLTLVVGRNGSGKSSFAEGLELLVTGDTYRWANRTKVWREGWRNLHHKPARIEAEFHIEGEKAPTTIVTQWEDDADLAGAKTHAQTLGKKQMAVADLGWDAALQTYRPFLSYNELGSMLDEGPSKLFDALAAILGLEKEAAAQETLADARKVREKAHKEAAAKKDELVAKLKTIEDERSRKLIEALEKKDWGLDAVETALVQTATGSATESDVQILRQLANLQAPQAEAVATVANDLREAQKQVAAAAGTLAAHSQDLADILDQALLFHKKHGDANCPICGKKDALNAQWRDEQTKHVLSLRQLATDATNADRAAEAARKRANQLFNTDALAALRLPRHPEDHRLAVDPKDLVTRVRRLANRPSLIPRPRRPSRSRRIQSPSPHRRNRPPSAPPPPPSSPGERTAGSPSPRSSPPGSPKPPRPRRATPPSSPSRPQRTGSRRTSPTSATTTSPRSRKRPSRSGASSASRATSPSRTSASPAPPPGARSTSTSRSTAPRARPSAS